MQSELFKCGFGDPFNLFFDRNRIFRNEVLCQKAYVLRTAFS